MADSDQEPDRPDIYTEYVNVTQSVEPMHTNYETYGLDELEERVGWYERQDIPNNMAVLEYGRKDLTVLENAISNRMEHALDRAVVQMETPDHVEYLGDLIYRSSDLRWQYETVIQTIDLIEMGKAAPEPTSRYGLSQSMMHPAALIHPANPLLTRPNALTHTTALAGVDDLQINEPESIKEEPVMPLADVLRAVGVGIANQVIEAGERLVVETSSMVVQEAGRAAEQIAQLADLRLNSAATFMRDVPAVERTSAEPMGPALQPPTPALDQVVQQAATAQPQEIEHELER